MKNKYTLELEINLPRDKVIELWDNPDNMKHWQPDLISFEHMSGEPGQVGAKSKILYRMGKKEIVMIQTITSKNLPDEFSGTLETKGLWNKFENRFSELGSDKTKLILDGEFKCEGYMRILAFLMPSMFKKQSFRYMERFKEFAEKA